MSDNKKWSNSSSRRSGPKVYRKDASCRKDARKDASGTPLPGGMAYYETDGVSSSLLRDSGGERAEKAVYDGRGTSPLHERTNYGTGLKVYRKASGTPLPGGMAYYETVTVVEEESSSRRDHISDIQESLEQLSWNMTEMMKKMAEKSGGGCNRCAGRGGCRCGGGDVLYIQPQTSQTVRVASPGQHVRVASPVQYVEVAPPAPVRVDPPVQLQAPCCCSVHCGPTKAATPQKNAACALHRPAAQPQCQCTAPQEVVTISPEPCNDRPNRSCCGAQGPCCRPSSPIYIIQEPVPPTTAPDMSSEDIPDEDIQAIKDRLKELEDPTNKPKGDLKPLMDCIDELKIQFLVTVETLNERLNGLKSKIDDGDGAWNGLIERVTSTEHHLTTVVYDIKHLETLLQSGMKPNDDLIRRLNDINDVHDYIKTELGNITIRMETINNIDTTVGIQRERLGEAEDMLKRHCDEETASRNALLKKLQAIENSLRSAEKNRNETDRRTDRLTDKLDSLTRTITDQNTRVDKMSSEITNSMKDFEKQVSRLEPQLDRQKDMIEDLKGDKAKNNHDLKNLRDKLADLENALRRLNDMGPGGGRGGGRGGGPGGSNSNVEIVVEEMSTTEAVQGGGGGGGGD